MKKIIIVLLAIISLMLWGCGWNKVCVKERKSNSYNLGEEKITVVGAEMIQKTFSTTQCISTRYEPTGLNLFLLKRKTEIVDTVPYDETVEKELLYAGRQGDTLHITYREYTGSGLARTPFFQQAYYDLKTSNEIVFQNWVIKIIDANNQQIKFKVVKE